MNLLSSGTYNCCPISNALRHPDDVGDECFWKKVVFPDGGSVAIRPEKNSFWQIDLGRSHDITRIRLRGMDNLAASDNVQARVCNDESANDCSDCGNPMSPPSNRSAEVTCLQTGRYVRLFRADAERNWHFCRVSIYSLKGEYCEIKHLKMK